jgi:hypothetical protein
MQGRVGYPLVAFSAVRGRRQKMNPATRGNERNANAPVLYIALELSNKPWKLVWVTATDGGMSAPAYEPTAKFPVRVENGDIQVRDDRWD